MQSEMLIHYIITYDLTFAIKAKASHAMGLLHVFYPGNLHALLLAPGSLRPKNCPQEYGWNPSSFSGCSYICVEMYGGREGSRAASSGTFTASEGRLQC